MVVAAKNVTKKPAGNKAAAGTSILSRMRQSVVNASAGNSQIAFLKPNTKMRIRFLTGIEQGIYTPVHDNFDGKVNNVPCYSLIGRECPYCEGTAPVETKKKEYFAWPIWQYDETSLKGDNAQKGRVKIFWMKAVKAGVIEQLEKWYNTEQEAGDGGDITDRDWIFERTGESTDTRYSLQAAKAYPFKVPGVKVPDEDAILKLIFAAQAPDLDADVDNVDVDPDVEGMFSEDDDEE